MGKKKVFVSFDYDKDRNYYYLMKAWDKNSNFEFGFSDYTSKEIDSDDVSVVKQVLSRKINEATYTLVLIGEDANRKHKDSKEIGYTNWQNYEVAKSYQHGNRLVGVKIKVGNSSPTELLGKGASFANSFTQEAIIAALNKAAE